jgi:hydroxypyruvate reductase
MFRYSAQLRRDALEIWQAGVEAVRSERLVAETLRVEQQSLWIGGERLPLRDIGRIAVVGAGKAGAGMAAAVETALGPRLAQEKQLAGWVNVPADCAFPKGTVPFSSNENRDSPQHENRDSPRIKLHAARPAGVNEPTPAGVAGAEEILRLVGSLTPADLCLCLVSGGGSALLPAPEGVGLEDKLALTRHLSAAGANIEQLNTVRKQLSRIKGGGLARACRAGRLVALIISDVLGDPLDLIASGPTVLFDRSTPEAALEVLWKFPAPETAFYPRVLRYLEEKQGRRPDGNAAGWAAPTERDAIAPLCRVTNLVIGNNAKAVDAAGNKAESLGYRRATTCAARSEGPAEDVGRQLAEMALRMRAGPGPNCLISGGEPVVRLVEPSRRGLGGRNQQLVLAALERLAGDGAEGIALLSGGTDGEDGPTDAAGAVLDAAVLAAARQKGLDPAAYLARNDAYHFFAPLEALVKTGPTHTNVCDVRVVLAQAK